MMKVQVLASVMNETVGELAERMRLESDAVIVNQCDEFAYERYEYKGYRIDFCSFPDRGVGRSRNEAILRADGDICLFADADLVYRSGYATGIAEEFEKNPSADMIIFNVDVAQERRTYWITERKRVRWYNSGRYGAVGFAIRRESLLRSGVMYSLLFGGGARYSNGEDSLFLMDLLKKGYRIYTAPLTIAEECAGESTWFHGYDRSFFYDRGVLYRALYGRAYWIMALRFLLVHKSQMCQQVSVREAYRWMLQGSREGR